MMRGVRYHFERFERGDRGAFLARLRVYDSADFPPELISSLMQSRHIVPYAAAPRNLVTPDKLRLECRL